MKTKNILIPLLTSTSLVALFYISFQQINAIGTLRQNVTAIQTENEKNKLIIQSSMNRPLQQDSTHEPLLTDPNDAYVKDIMKHLSGLKESIDSFEKRITALERQNPFHNSALTEPLSEETELTETSADDETMSDSEYSQQEARKNFYNSLETAINSEIDEAFTQDVKVSFEQMILSREDWAQATALKSAECSKNQCKVVFSYNNNMDPISQSEFDNSIYFWNKNLPRAMARYEGTPDGTTDIIMYFAKKGSRLPAIP